MAEPEDAGTKATRTPPYISFKSFLTLLEELKVNGIPPQVDRSVLRRFSGGLGGQLVMGMKSLGMLTDDNRFTPTGVRLVEAFGTDGFKPVLTDVLSASYSFLNKIDLKTATPSMFADAFKSATSAKEDVLKKARRFYLHAAEYVGMPLGPRLKGAVPKATNSPSGGGARRKAKPSANTKEKPGARTPTSPGESSLSDFFRDQLLTKFPAFDPTWPDPIKAKWFEGFGQFMEMTKKQSGG